MLRRLATFCYARRRAVLATWLVLLVGISVLGKVAGGDLLKTFSLPGSESQRAFDVLSHDFERKGDTGDLVFKVRGAGTRSPRRGEGRDRAGSRTLRKQPHVASITSPYDAAGARFVSNATQDRLRRDPLRRAGRTTCRSTWRRTCATSWPRRTRRTLQIELGGSMFTDQTPARQRG